MGILAWIFGGIGGLSVGMGIITAIGAIPLLGTELTAMFWLALSTVLFLVTITFTIMAAGSAE
ncbi:hypothetical protein ACFLYI_01135 [Chloroflexota bacterium]